MPSIFSKIIAGEIPCAKVWENTEFLAFLDVMPIAAGHTLVIPKKEIDYFFDIEEDAYTRLMLSCRPIAHALKQVTGCKKVSVCVYGYEVPHAHVHLIPMDNLDQFKLKDRAKANPGDLTALAQKIQAALPKK